MFEDLPVLLRGAYIYLFYFQFRIRWWEYTTVHLTVPLLVDIEVFPVCVPLDTLTHVLCCAYMNVSLGYTVRSRKTRS